MLTEDQVEVVVKRTVTEMFLRLGIDTSDADGVLEWQKDQHHLRADRKRKESIENRAWSHIVIMVISAIGAAFILGASQALGFEQ